MKEKEYISVVQLCQYYEIEPNFIDELFEEGLIDLNTKNQAQILSIEQIPRFERIVRLNKDLEVNTKGIDIILNLIQRIEDLKSEINITRSRLSIYE